MPLSQTFTIQTGARLHFGLWAWGPEHERQFGGLGMMVDEPRLLVRFAEAHSFEAAGTLGERVRQFAQACVRHWQLDGLPRCRVEVVTEPPQHAGFGVGTQLGLAVARGIAEWCELGTRTAPQLAMAAGRGLRSAVGTHGFAEGGLLVDAGKGADEEVGILSERVAVPDAWRVVLVTPRNVQGMAGAAERSAFAKLPPLPAAVTEKLQHLATKQIVPACRTSDFALFAESLYEYGLMAGKCFAAVQGGPYAGDDVTQVVRLLRALGAMGVGQTSWGPTVFAFARNEEQASLLAEQASTQLLTSQYRIAIAKARNEGARLSREEHNS